ncbi:porin [Alphaproteobacteria bacterium]|nr:porin [Alphaproteobacteria bacterium]
MLRTKTLLPLVCEAGGHLNQDDGAAQDLSDFNIKLDPEVQFQGSTTLDNRISLVVNVQPEGNSNSFDQIDGSYLIVKDGFGEINLGSENSAMNKMNFAPAELGIGINTSHQTGWVSQTTNAARSRITEGGYFHALYGSTYIESIRANDSEKLPYFTPKVEGFQLGLFYAPEPPKDNISQPNRDTSLVIAGWNFNCSFDSASFGPSWASAWWLMGAPARTPNYRCLMLNSALVLVASALVFLKRPMMTAARMMVLA